MRRDWSFLRKPKWIAAHLLALTGILIFVNLGFWQLRRLDDRRQINERIEARMTGDVTDLGVLLDAVEGDPDQLEYQLVSAQGRYVNSESVILRSRTRDGISGHHVLTPLVLGDGRVLIVERGWVPIDALDLSSTEIAPVATDVELTGVLLKTQERDRFGPTDPADGVLTQIARVDLVRLDQQVAGELVTVYLRLLSQNPAQPQLPHLIDPPEITEGPHLAYAGQWFLFTLVVAVGYPVLMRKTATTPRTKREQNADS